MTALTDQVRSSLDELARSMIGPFAFCGIAVAHNGDRHYAIAQQPFLDADTESMFRVASVSKIVVGQAVSRLLATHGLGWDHEVSDLLGWTLRNPAYPDVPISIGAVASHSAGLDDGPGYLVPAGETLPQFFSTNRFSQHRPGAYFAYSNLGYVVLAAVIERLSGRDFAQAVASLIPDGGGYNWAGVAKGRVASCLPTFRRDGSEFVAQIDDPARFADGADSVVRYAPQGGLRLSLKGMLELAEWLAQADRTVLWRQVDGPGDYLDGVFGDYGAGLQIYDAPMFYPRPLVGHFGNAYGFNGGVWRDATAGLSFAYALNGLEAGDEDDSFSDAERAIFDAIAMINGD